MPDIVDPQDVVDAAAQRELARANAVYYSWHLAYFAVPPGSTPDASSLVMRAWHGSRRDFIFSVRKSDVMVSRAQPWCWDTISISSVVYFG